MDQRPDSQTTDMITGKKFRTWRVNFSSEVFLVEDGLQRGTVNSPILFNIYTSGLLNLYNLNNNNNRYAIAFADDLIVYLAGKNIKLLQEQLDHIKNQNTSDYLVLQSFIYFDKIGAIQDLQNIPKIYHRARHKTDKEIIIVSGLLNPITASNNCYFPKNWKCAKILPILKPGKNENKANYRPISITPTLSKVYEAGLRKY